MTFVIISTLFLALYVSVQSVFTEWYLDLIGYSVGAWSVVISKVIPVLITFIIFFLLIFFVPEYQGSIQRGADRQRLGRRDYHRLYEVYRSADQPSSDVQRDLLDRLPPCSCFCSSVMCSGRRSFQRRAARTCINIAHRGGQ